jgi:hypothetical protein
MKTLIQLGAAILIFLIVMAFIAAPMIVGVLNMK